MRLALYWFTLGALTGTIASAQTLIHSSNPPENQPESELTVARGESEFEIGLRGFTGGGGSGGTFSVASRNGAGGGSAFSVILALAQFDAGTFSGGGLVVKGGILVGGAAQSGGCGDGFCDSGEDICTCTADCGTPPQHEEANLNCLDGADNDCDTLTDCDDPDCAADPSCEDGAIPTVSVWGMCILAILLLIGGRIYSWRRTVC